MLTHLALFATNRATHGAVDALSRRASWGAVAALLLTCTIVFATIAAYAYLRPSFVPVGAAGLIGGTTLALALACMAALALRAMMEALHAKQHRDQVGPVTATVNVVSKEAEAAVDNFGPLQVVTTSFLVGLRPRRQLRGNFHV
jgi:hypothetical protein